MDHPPTEPCSIGPGLWRRPVPGRVAWGVIAGACVIVTALFWWLESGSAGRAHRPGEGDPRAWLYDRQHLIPDSARASWGFNFEPCRIPRHQIILGQARKEMASALVEPDWLPAAAADAEEPPDNRVIGVTVGGAARAYPTDLLFWHEVANDMLGGEPIAVHFNPISGLIMAFSRRSGGQVREFGLSGLIYQSTELLHDRQEDPHDESLWDPLLQRAVCGPGAAGDRLRLEPLDCLLTTWADWRRRHPETTVLALRTGYELKYGIRFKPAKPWEQSLLYPVSVRSGRRRDLFNQDQLVWIHAGGAARAYPVGDLRRIPDGVLRDRIGGVDVELRYDRDADCVDLVTQTPIRAPAGAPGLASVPGPGAGPLFRSYINWFAWDANFPDGALHGS